MVREKKILSYILGWFLVGYIILFIGINNVNAQVIEPTTGFRSQIGLLKTDDTLQWNTSDIGGYGNMLYFGAGPSYSTWGIPAYMRLITITDISNNYSYKISYNMTIFTPNSTSNTWDSSKLDNNYNLIVADDQGVVKESKCSVVSSDSFSGDNGTFTTKSISCIINVNKSESNVWLSAGYSCKNCSLSSLEQLGYVPQDSYMYITNPILEQFNDNSNIIVDQNQTIIDQNSQIIQGQDNIINNNKENTDSIIENNNQNTQDIIDSNKETQEVIKDQFKSCRPSINLAYDVTYSDKNNNYGTLSTVISTNIIKGKTYTISIYLNADENTSAYWNKSSTIFDNTLFDVNSGTHRYTMTFVAKNDATELPVVLSKASTSDNIYIRPSKLQIQEGSIATEYEEPNSQVCSNKIDETNKELGNINDALTDSSLPNTSGLENSAGWLPPGPLDSVLNLPLSLFNSLTTNLNKSCNSINIPLPYVNKNITLPCINTLYNQIGITSFLSWIGVIVSGLMLYTYLLKLYKWIEDRISLNETHNVDSWGGL